MNKPVMKRNLRTRISRALTGKVKLSRVIQQRRARTAERESRAAQVGLIVKSINVYSGLLQDAVNTSARTAADAKRWQRDAFARLHTTAEEHRKTTEGHLNEARKRLSELTGKTGSELDDLIQRVTREIALAEANTK